MQVGLVTGKEQLTLVEMPDPEPAPGKAVVDVALCGICGTDIHAFQSGEPYNPAICGHEWTGNVSGVGANVSLKEGDRVAIGMATACGQCSTCVRGDPSHCESAFMGMIGAGPLAAPHGGFASAIAIDAGRLYPVDVDISDAAAAMLEPVTIAVHAVRRTGIRLGDSVVVLGAGPIGLLVLQCARAAGAGVCILVEPQDARRELGTAVGADHTINPKETTDIAGAINAIVGNAGADIVFECAGISRTVEQAPGYVRRGGTVALVGVPTAPSQFMAAEWLFKELRVSTALGYLRDDFEVSKGLVADGRVQCAPLHTSTVGLDGLAGAFAELASEPEQVKVLVDPRL
ncbi:MAG: zinc-binding dehydrogenase [Pseudomonadales bacterium]